MKIDESYKTLLTTEQLQQKSMKPSEIVELVETVYGKLLNCHNNRGYAYGIQAKDPKKFFTPWVVLSCSEPKQAQRIWNETPKSITRMDLDKRIYRIFPPPNKTIYTRPLEKFFVHQIFEV